MRPTNEDGEMTLYGDITSAVPEATNNDEIPNVTKRSRWSIGPKRPKDVEESPVDVVSEVNSESAENVWKPKSRIFDDWRKLGYVSSAVPLVLRYVHTRRENLIVTCTGESINTYAGQKLKLLSTSGVSGNGAKSISCMATDTYHVYTAVEDTIFVWRRGTELKRSYVCENEVKLLLPFADVLVSLDVKHKLLVWNIKTGEIERDMQLNSDWNVTALMHPLSLQNKVLIGTSTGELVLINVNTGWTHIFDTWKGKRINAIVQAPSLGVVAIALSNKKVALHNIEYDKVIVVLDFIDEPISIAFRTDDVPVMMVGGISGSISAWDLDREDIISFEKGAHQAAVTGLVAFMNEPIMVSSSSDNSVKVWIFDKTDGGFRLLTSRDGHRKSPRMIRFHGEKGFDILSVGEDRCMRRFHIYNETYNRTINNYLPQSDDEKGRGVPITNFATVGRKDYMLFEDIVGYCNSGGKEIYTFSFENAKRGHSLSLGKFVLTEISCVCLTPCNQFAIVGCKSGEVIRFNIQSKSKKGKYGGKQAHKGEVTALSVDSINTVVVSGGLDDCIKFWEFGKGNSLSTLECKSSVDGMFSQRGSNLFGVKLGNFEVWICSYTTRQVVRKLLGCRSPVTDACFTPDMRWVTAATESGLIRTWDTVTADLIDIFRVPMGMVVSMDYSPNGQYIACAISGHLGIFLWLNKSMFQHVSLSPIPLTYLPPEEGQHSPSFGSTVWDEAELDENEKAVESFLNSDLLYGLAILAHNARHRWKELLNLRTLMDRNKPVDPAKTFSAPFLLGTTSANPLSTGIKRGTEDSPSDPFQSRQSKFVKFGTLLSPFAELLLENPESDKLITTLEAMSPTALDYEMISLGMEGLNGEEQELLPNFLKFINRTLELNGHFETCNAYLALFLKAYHAEVHKSPTMINLLNQIQLKLTSGSLMSNINMIASLIDHTKSNLL